MANKEISDLTTVSIPLDGTEVVHAKQGANSREVNFGELANFIGKGPVANGLGHAKFTQPGDVFTAYNNGTPVQNVFDAVTGHWVIEHEQDDEFSYAMMAQAAGDFDHVFVMSAMVVSDDGGRPQFGLAVSDGVDAINFTIMNILTALTFEENYRNTDRFTFGSTNTTVTRDVGMATPYYSGLIWMRITRVTAALTFYVSHNGFDWDPIFTSTDTANSMSSVLEVGVFMSSDSVADATTNFCRIVGLDSGPQAEAYSGGGTLPVAFKGFRATNNTTQSYTAETETELDLQTEIFDTEGAFASNRFTVPAGLDGKYGIFDTGMKLAANESGAFYIEVSTDGGSAWTKVAQGGFITQDGAAVTSGAYLLAADDIWRAVFTLSAGTIANDARTFFSMGILESSEDAFDYVEDTGTSRTATAADFKGNRVLELTNASPIALVLNTGLAPAGPLTIIAGGAGQITVSGTATIESAGSALKSNGQHTSFTLIPTQTTDVYKMIGDITT